MPKALTIAPNQIATVPMGTTDQNGATLPPPVDAAVSSSNPAIAATLSGGNVVLQPTKLTGSSTITLSNGSGLAIDTVVVTIGFQQPVAMFLDVGNAALSPNPIQPTG